MNQVRRLVLAHYVVCYAALGIVVFFLPFSLFGQDAYLGWGPIISEYLQGDEVFTHSQVVFGGQNLLAVYGYLPFWKLFRQLGLNFIQVENLTLWVFYIFLQYYAYSIFRFFRTGFGLADFYVPLLYTLLSPIIVNRVYSGHINLLFALLPSFVVLQLMISSSKTSLLMNTLSLWFAFSVQGYQLLVYNIFYLPIFAVFFMLYVQDWRRFLPRAGWVGLVGVGLALPALVAMIQHAVSSENIRGMGVNMVYSYSWLGPLDLLNLVFSSIENPFTSHKSMGLFHEITYPMGILGFVFIISDLPRRLKMSFLVVFVVTLLFSSNVVPMNWLAQLPFIAPFRVPQRSLMFLTFLVPLLVLSRTKWDLSLIDFFLPVGAIGVFLITPHHESVVFILLGLLLIASRMWQQEGWLTTLVLTGMVSLSLGFVDKIPLVRDSYAAYRGSERLLRRAVKQFAGAESMDHYVFHLDGAHHVQLNATAKILGLKTMEGYGHPPKGLVEMVEKLNGQTFTAGQNHLYVDKTKTGYHETLKALGVNYVLKFEQRE